MPFGQLSFAFDDANAVITARKETAGPRDLSEFNISRNSFEEVLKSLGYGNRISSRYHSWHICGNHLTITRETADRTAGFNIQHLLNGDETVFAYVDDEMKLWKCSLEATVRSNSYAYDDSYITDYRFSKWSAVKNVRLAPDYVFIQPREELARILKDRKPYTEEWRRRNMADVECCILAPYLEILDKAGYCFVRQFLKYDTLNSADTEALGRLCKDGTKPKDIFKTGKPVYTALKRECHMNMWDCYRKMFKFGRINSDTIQQAYDMHLDGQQLDYINSILSIKYDDRNVFTWQTMMQYLVRVDTFEAIPTREALPLLNDYLHMCKQLKMKPRTDGDSLKREHDIAARNVRNRRDEIMAEKMQASCERMKRYDYSENIYMVRGIRDYNDLLDEAGQQHNCVASYGSRIAQGASLIYVMREVSCPEKSLITIELSPDGRTIRQKYLAYNQPIRNKSQSDFIDRWLRHIKSVA